MIRIKDVLREIITDNSFIQFGFGNGLFNLSRLAAFIRPIVEIRARKEIKTSAILMNLSRLQKEVKKITPTSKDFEITHITVRSGLCLASFDTDKRTHQKVNELYLEVQKQNGYMTINHGIHEITLIIDHDSLKLLKKFIKLSPKYLNTNIAALSVQFTEEFFERPGLLYSLIQQTTLQNINILELSSTYTELVFYIDKKDVSFAFNTIQARFLKKR